MPRSSCGRATDDCLLSDLASFQRSSWWHKPRSRKKMSTWCVVVQFDVSVYLRFTWLNLPVNSKNENHRAVDHMLGTFIFDMPTFFMLNYVCVCVCMFCPHFFWSRPGDVHVGCTWDGSKMAFCIGWTYVCRVLFLIALFSFFFFRVVSCRVVPCVLKSSLVHVFYFFLCVWQC